jgi:hypothetical protein
MERDFLGIGSEALLIQSDSFGIKFDASSMEAAQAGIKAGARPSLQRYSTFDLK